MQISSMKEVVLTALIRLSSLIETASASFWVTLWKPMPGALSQNMRKKLLSETSMSFRISMSSETSQTRLAFVSSFRSLAILKKSSVPSAKSARPHPTAQPTFWRKKRRHMNSEKKWKGDKTESKMKWTWLITRWNWNLKVNMKCCWTQNYLNAFKMNWR